MQRTPQPNPLLESIMEALWGSIGPKDRKALRFTLYTLNVQPYEGLGPTDQVDESFIPYDALEDLGPYAVAPKVIIVIGGYDGTNVLSYCVALDPLAVTWSSLPPMPSKRYDFGVAHVDGKIIVIGGPRPCRTRRLFLWHVINIIHFF